MLSVVIVGVIMLNVVMLGVVAPGKHYDVFKLKRFVYLQTLNEKNELALWFVLLSDATNDILNKVILMFRGSNPIPISQ